MRTIHGRIEVKPLGDTVFLGTVPLAEARSAIEASLNRFARVSAYESWLAKAQERALAEAVCVGDQLPSPAALTLDDLLPFVAPGFTRRSTRHRLEGSMAKKADFTEQEWDQLRQGATGAGMLVAVSDRSFRDSFKEASSLAKHLAGGRSGDSELIRELSSERGTGFGLTTSPQEIESEHARRAAVGASRRFESKAPEDVEAYKSFVLELAESVGKAAGGGDEAEAAAVEKIRSALGS